MNSMCAEWTQGGAGVILVDMFPGADHPRVAVVGAGRTRNGLGPFLARFVEDAGATVVAAVGRDVGSAAVGSAGLVERLGHLVHPCVALEDVLSRGADTMIIATPAETHGEFLEWAAKEAMHTLCEKPLLGPEAMAQGGEERIAACLQQFQERRRVVRENCQWPFLLPAFESFHPGVIDGEVTEVAMGLGPTSTGKEMVDESLSHLLSLAQGVAFLGPETEVHEVTTSDRAPEATEITLDVRLTEPDLALRLEVQQCETQPRPAWFAINGHRVDRVVEMPSYNIQLEADGRRVPVVDPMALLVREFVAAIQEWSTSREVRIRDEIATRARLFRSVSGAW